MLGRRDMLLNIVALKMLAAYPDAIQAQNHEDGAEAAALLLPTRLALRRADRHILRLGGAAQRDAPADRAGAARTRGGDCALVFKLISSSDRDGVAQRFRLTRATAGRVYLQFKAFLEARFFKLLQHRDLSSS